ncbi:MAG: DUF1049 domain-containing protein [Aliifodinibius sp.]|nr:LapA family protein [Fodinibius sp.]NIV16707.1 DUF1049 domain-containing protein [Fodinibius sp.]NIY30274.1 DUF1049 domain-containing protein [Fodinibius sp.]
MKIALNLLKILIFIFALFILAQNTRQYVDIELLTYSYSNVNLLVVILVSLTIGAVLGAVFMAFSIIQSHSQVKELRNKNRQLINELENLRNISIEEIPDEDFSLGPVSASKPSPEKTTANQQTSETQ